MIPLLIEIIVLVSFAALLLLGTLLRSEEEEIPVKQFLVTYRIYAQDLEDAKCIAEETKDDMYYNNDFDPEIVGITEVTE